jgi:hypothetical protein
MPVTTKYYAADAQARRIPDWINELLIAPMWQRYESAKTMLAELKTWDMNRADVDYAERLRAEATQEITNFEQRFPDAQYKIQEIWEYDLMPDRTVVEDFYKTHEFGQLQIDQALWEKITEDTLDEVVPDEDFQAYAQWRVTLPGRDGNYSMTWMIYQWWDGSGMDDDCYLYENITPPNDFGPGSPAIQRETIKHVRKAG